ncbi:hypothetical protein HDU84_002618 [Entophlyctis sp. JEL0112]|nr:hypothetical protein HDU84_002618 [Entophlyctis sp. JEL0112]
MRDVGRSSWQHRTNTHCPPVSLRKSAMSAADATNDGPLLRADAAYAIVRLLLALKQDEIPRIDLSKILMSATCGHTPAAHSSGCECSAGTVYPSTAQTLDELDFSRSLHGASSAGNIERVRRLLAGGSVSVNAFDSAGYTPLHYAARLGHLDVVRMLVEHGADLNVPTRGLRATALMRAVMGGHAHVARFLADSGADQGLRDIDGRDVAALVEALPPGSELRTQFAAAMVTRDTYSNNRDIT